MTNIILPFLMSMLLGRTIDLATYNIGGSIYDDEDYDEVLARSINTTYHVLQGDNFPYSSFGLPADIVLRIKSNFLSSSSGAMGLDGLLKDNSWKYNSVVVGITSVYRTVDRSLKKDATVLNNWQSKIPKSMTHYAQSLFYGGWCVVLFQFQCDIPGDVQEVRKSLTETLGIMGELNDDVLNKWEKAIQAINKNDNVRGQVKLSTHTYSTVHLKHDVTSPEDLLKVLKDLPEAVGTLGQPLYMNLLPLHSLNKEYPKVEEDEMIVGDLEKLDEMFDDVKLTKVRLMRWISETIKTFSDEEEEKVSDLLKKINDCIRVFSKVNGEVSLYKKMDSDVLESAFHQYLSGLDRGLGTYNLAYMKLKEEIDAECEDNFLHKIRGMLKVYDNEMIKKGKVDGGLNECMKLCIKDSKCRAVGYSDHLSELDLSTGRYLKLLNQCWIFFRSTSTAMVYTSSEFYGEIAIYDRNCYI